MKGRTVHPLTRQPDGMQAWKIVIPTSKAKPEPRTHEGYECLYVLSGRMRLFLADLDLELGHGEVVEFDTRVPHWFGNGTQPVEILSLFGRHGERMHVRAATPGEAKNWPSIFGRPGRGPRGSAPAARAPSPVRPALVVHTRVTAGFSRSRPGQTDAQGSSRGT